MANSLKFWLLSAGLIATSSIVLFLLLVTRILLFFVVILVVVCFIWIWRQSVVLEVSAFLASGTSCLQK